MLPPGLRIRRATVDDLETLKVLWANMRLSPEALEPRLTEFQVVENSESQVLGAIGLQISGQQALLHSEGYSDFGVADPARDLFWERIQKIAANQGVFRIWTQERSPIWKSFGFQPPAAELLPKLPEAWKNEFEGGWLTLQLKDEAVINAAIEKHMTTFLATEKMEAERVSEKIRGINTFIIIAGFGIGFISIGFAVYLFMHSNPFQQH
jgi:N-acetylglutamate synthase-like GNAT family acetyltransferase